MMPWLRLTLVCGEPIPPAFRFITLTSPMRCTPFVSKLHQPAPLVFLP